MELGHRFRLVKWRILLLTLAYLASFSIRQSIVLTLLLTLLAYSIGKAAVKPVRRFRPYYVRVAPDWCRLLTDFKLIGKPEDWRAIHKSLNELSSTDYCVMRDGICFTVIYRSEDLERELIYSNNHRAFSSEFAVKEQMNPIRIKRGQSIIEHRHNEYDILFFIKPGTRGYDLGLIVPDWWWNEAKASCPEPMAEDTDYGTGRVSLILTTISNREFDLYWEPVKWSDEFYSKTARQIRERREEQRRAFGWKTVEHPDIPELSIRWPESIQHEYVGVEHRDI
jgi:hypothetical protein